MQRMLNKDRNFSCKNYLIFSSTIQTDTGTNLTDSIMTTQNKLVRQLSQVIKSSLSLKYKYFF
jgi:hypothetical protein